MFFSGSIYVKTFDVPHKVLKIMGLMKIDSENSALLRKFHQVYLVWAMTFYVNFMLLTIYKTYLVWGDSHLATTEIISSTTMVGVFLKTLLFMRNRERIRRLRVSLSATLSEEVHLSCRPIYEKAATEMRVESRIIYITCAVMLNLFIFSGLLSSMALRNFNDNFFPSWMLWEVRGVPMHVFSYLYQTYGIFLVGIVGISINLIIYGSVIQICAEYETLEKNMVIIKEWCTKKDKNEVRLLTPEENEEVQELLVKNVKHHQRIIQSVCEMESIYVHLFFLQFALTGSLGTLLSVEMILGAENIDIRALIPILFFALLCVDIFLFCLFGTRLKDKSIDFLYAIYAVPWIMMSTQNRRLICLMMLKAQRPTKLSTGKLSDLDLGSLLVLTKIVYNFVYLIIQLSSSHKSDMIN